MIGDRIKTVKERLEKVKRQRGTQRKARERRGTFRVSLVGYTNAGKSTLFNALVKARAYAADQLFATLDTTTRSLWLGRQGAVSLSDTVGFIRDLPHKLVEAFEATLQEAADADLLLHVMDAASPNLAEQQPKSSACWTRSAPGRAADAGLQQVRPARSIPAIARQPPTGLKCTRRAPPARVRQCAHGRGPGSPCARPSPRLGGRLNADANAPPTHPSRRQSPFLPLPGSGDILTRRRHRPPRSATRVPHA
jgi:hypothetical protein